LAVEMDQPRYLRDNAYDKYTGHGWSHNSFDGNGPSLPGDRVWPTGRVFHRVSLAQKVLKNPVKLHFSVEVLNGIFETLPVPGEVTQITVPPRYMESSSM